VEERHQKDDRQLFGTLLDSKPARSRSSKAIALAVALHIVLGIVLLVVTKPFAPTLANKLFEQITIIIPEEEQPVFTPEPEPQPQQAPSPAQAPTSPAVRDRRAFEEIYTPSEVTPGIPEPQPGPETSEISDNGVTGSGSLTERLRPRVIDPRLSGGATYALPPDASPAAAVNARIAMGIAAYNDSIAAETEARQRGLDWTLKTKDGKKWGIGPDGKIHLGDVTLPPLVAFTPAAGRRDEIRARNRDFAEIERQASAEVGRQSFNQRVKAIRARKDKEREEKKKAQENAPISAR
jgi:hypothetical protein